MEEIKTTTIQLSGLGSPFEEPPSRTALELEETHADEPFWLKVLCFLGGVFPIVRENGKCKCDCKTVGWCTLPLIYNMLLVLAAIMSTRNTMFSTIWLFIEVLLLISLSIALTLTRNKFAKAIAVEEKSLSTYTNTFAKKCIIVCIVLSVLCGFIFGGWSYGFSHLLIFCQCSVVVLRSIYVSHISVTQQKDLLMEMVKAMEVGGGLQAFLLGLSKKIQKTQGAGPAEHIFIK